MNNQMSNPSTPTQKLKDAKERYHCALQAYYPERVAYDNFMERFDKFREKMNKRKNKGADYPLYDAYEADCIAEGIIPDRESLHFSASEEEQALMQKLEDFIESLEPEKPTMDRSTVKLERLQISPPSGSWGVPLPSSIPLPAPMDSHSPARMRSHSPPAKRQEMGRAPWYE
jgi:hypothetical protein